MSATEQMRAMLDGLMGTARDGSDSQRQHLHFTDARVCRAFLLDCCPHDIFTSTKLELGECPKVHDPALRADYILANKSEDYMYEISACERLQAFVSEADKKTEYLKRKLAETQEELTAEETNKLNRVHDLTEKLGKKLAQVEKAEADDDLEAKQKLIDESERIKRERAVAEAEYRQVSRPASSHQQQNLRVCDICSAYLGINDNDSRLADHFGGKLHLGFITVREKLEDLKKIVAEKRASSNRARAPPGAAQLERPPKGARVVDRERDRDREFEYDYDRHSRDYERTREREYHRSRSRDFDRYRDRDYDRDRYRERDRIRDSRYREVERDRSHSSGRYYREESHSRPRERYREERVLDRVDKIDRLERNDSIISSRSIRSAFDRADSRHLQEREATYQRRLREWEKRESEKARKYEMRASEEQDRKQLEEQESRKLKEFLEDYKDDRDDARFYRGSALARRLADRRKEIEHDELTRQKEKMELEILSRSCAVENSSPQPIERAGEITDPAIIKESATDGSSVTIAPNIASSTIVVNNFNNSNLIQSNGDSSGKTSEAVVKNNALNNNINTSSTSSKPTTTAPTRNSEDKRKQVEELIGKIPTEKDQLFACQLDWSLLDENLMERRIRPWVTKKIAEYLGEKEVDLIDFVCTLLNNRSEGKLILREVATVLDDEAEKFVVHMWRLLIFELEAKKIGLRK